MPAASRSPMAGTTPGRSRFKPSALAPEAKFATTSPIPVTSPKAQEHWTGSFDERQIDLGFWESMRGSGKAVDFEAYLRSFLNGIFAALAHSKLEDLRRSTAADVDAAEKRPASGPAPLSPPAEDGGRYRITTMAPDPVSPSPSRVEVITSVQRRRHWSTAEKIRLVEEAMQPGMSVSYVARRRGFRLYERSGPRRRVGIRLVRGASWIWLSCGLGPAAKRRRTRATPAYHSDHRRMKTTIPATGPGGTGPPCTPPG